METDNRMSDYAPLYGEVWGDPRWRQLSKTAQWLYLMLMSSPSRNAAGIVQMQPIGWANCAVDATVDEMHDAIGELVAQRYIDVDDDTQEVILLGFIENDAIRNPTFYVSSLKHARNCQSPRLRAVLFKAVQGVHPPDLSCFKAEKVRERRQAGIDAAYDAFAERVQRDAAADLNLPAVTFNSSPLPASVAATTTASVTTTTTRGDAMGDAMGDQTMGHRMGDAMGDVMCSMHPDQPAVDGSKWCADCLERERRWQGQS